MSKPKTYYSQRELESQIALTKLAVDMETVKTGILEIKGQMERDFVTREEFEPIKKGFWGLVSAVLLAVIGGIMTLILR